MQIGDVESVIEERRLKSILEGCPVAADDAVVGNDGLEDAAVVVGTMPMLGRKHYFATLVTDEVFIVRGNQEETAPSESACSAIIGHIEFVPLMFFQMNRVAQELYSLSTFPVVQSRPPDEVFERSRLSALEIFSRKQHQSFISIHLDVLPYLVG